MATYGFLLVFLSVITHAYGDCPHGFEHVNDSCYKIEALESSWVEAKMLCRVLGSELAVIDNAAEESSVVGIITRVHGSHIDETYWLAGADITNENDWRWFGADGVSYPIVYTSWLSGRPDNIGGNENCLTLRYHGGGKSYWNDEGCNAQHSFICESKFESEPIVG